MLNLNTDYRTVFFSKIAPYYDILLDLFTLGLYAKFLKKAVAILAPREGERILDLCSGTGRAASWTAQAVGKEGEVIGMDISKKMVEVARKRYGALGNVSFLKNDVTEPWGYQNYFDGIFTSFALHELPGEKRIRVLDQSYLALKEKGRMVIVDFNPELSGVRRIILLSFFKPFEKENLNFLSFGQREMLKRVGFKGIKTFPVLAGILQISLALKE